MALRCTSLNDPQVSTVQVPDRQRYWVQWMDKGQLCYVTSEPPDINWLDIDGTAIAV